MAQSAFQPGTRQRPAANEGRGAPVGVGVGDGVGEGVGEGVGDGVAAVASATVYGVARVSAVSASASRTIAFAAAREGRGVMTSVARGPHDSRGPIPRGRSTKVCLVWISLEGSQSSGQRPRRRMGLQNAHLLKFECVSAIRHRAASQQPALR